MCLTGLHLVYSDATCLTREAAGLRFTIKIANLYSQITIHQSKYLASQRPKPKKPRAVKHSVHQKESKHNERRHGKKHRTS